MMNRSWGLQVHRFLLAMFVVGKTAESQQDCHCQYGTGNETIYFTFRRTLPLDWEYSNDEATRLGGRLAVLDSVEKQDVVGYCIRNCTGNTRNLAWVGLVQNGDADRNIVEPAGGWQFVDGTYADRLGLDVWAVQAGKPDDCGRAQSDPAYVPCNWGLFATRENRFYDAPKQRFYPQLFEWPKGVLPPPVVSTYAHSPQDCHFNYTVQGHVVSSMVLRRAIWKNYMEAFVDAVGSGGRLAVVDSTNKIEAIMKAIRKCYGYEWIGPWVGLWQDRYSITYSEPRGGWKHSDGTRADATFTQVSTMDSSTQLWCPNMPDNWDSATEDCACVVDHMDALDDQPCWKLFPYIVEWPMPSASPSPSPSVTASPSVTVSPSRSASASMSPSTSASSSPSHSVSASVSASPSSSRSGSITSTGTGTASTSASGSSTLSYSTSATASPSASGSVSSSATLSTSNSVSTSATRTPSMSTSVTPVATVSTSGSTTGSATLSTSGSSTASPSVSASTSGSRTPSVSSSTSGTITLSGSTTASPSISASGTASVTVSGTVSASASISISSSATLSTSATAAVTPSNSISGSASVSGTSTASVSGTLSVSGTATVTASPSISGSGTMSASGSATLTRSGSSSVTASATPSMSATTSSSGSVSISVSSTASPSVTASASGSEGAAVAALIANAAAIGLSLEAARPPETFPSLYVGVVAVGVPLLIFSICVACFCYKLGARREMSRQRNFSKAQQEGQVQQEAKTDAKGQDSPGSTKALVKPSAPEKQRDYDPSHTYVSNPMLLQNASGRKAGAVGGSSSVTTLSTRDSNPSLTPGKAAQHIIRGQHPSIFREAAGPALIRRLVKLQPSRGLWGKKTHDRSYVDSEQPASAREIEGLPVAGMRSSATSLGRLSRESSGSGRHIISVAGQHSAPLTIDAAPSSPTTADEAQRSSLPRGMSFHPLATASVWTAKQKSQSFSLVRARLEAEAEVQPTAVSEARS